MLAVGMFACGTAAVAVLRPPVNAAPPPALPAASAGLPIERPLPSLTLRDDTGASVAFSD